MTVMLATPNLIFPETMREMYFASTGPASFRMSASDFIFQSWEPPPSEEDTFSRAA
jgi:hypothetical protein